MGKLLFNLIVFLVYLQIYLIIIIPSYLQASVDNFVNALLYSLKLHCPQSIWEEVALLN